MQLHNRRHSGRFLWIFLKIEKFPQQYQCVKKLQRSKYPFPCESLPFHFIISWLSHNVKKELSRSERRQNVRIKPLEFPQNIQYFILLCSKKSSQAVKQGKIVFKLQFFKIISVNLRKSAAKKAQHHTHIIQAPMSAQRFSAVVVSAMQKKRILGVTSRYVIILKQQLATNGTLPFYSLCKI